VQICLHSCCVIVLDVFLLLLCFISYILVILAQFCAVLLFLWTPVSARILALVLQLYERNKLNLNLNLIVICEIRQFHRSLENCL